jgi:hypothetical protein
MRLPSSFLFLDPVQSFYLFAPLVCGAAFCALIDPFHHAFGNNKNTSLALPSPFCQSQKQRPQAKRTRQLDAIEFLFCQEDGTSRLTRLPYPIVGITPSCCNIPSASKLSQPSSNVPLTMWVMIIPVTVTCLPVGGMPMRSA